MLFVLLIFDGLIRGGRRLSPISNLTPLLNSVCFQLSHIVSSLFYLFSLNFYFPLLTYGCRQPHHYFSFIFFILFFLKFVHFSLLNSGCRQSPHRFHHTLNENSVWLVEPKSIGRRDIRNALQPWELARPHLISAHYKGSGIRYQYLIFFSLDCIISCLPLTLLWEPWKKLG